MKKAGWWPHGFESSQFGKNDLRSSETNFTISVTTSNYGPSKRQTTYAPKCSRVSNRRKVYRTEEQIPRIGSLPLKYQVNHLGERCFLREATKSQGSSEPIGTENSVSVNFNCSRGENEGFKNCRKQPRKVFTSSNRDIKNPAQERLMKFNKKNEQINSQQCKTKNSEISYSNKCLSFLQGSDFIKQEPDTVEEEFTNPYQESYWKNQVVDEIAHNENSPKSLIDQSSFSSREINGDYECFKKSRRTVFHSSNEKGKILFRKKQINLKEENEQTNAQQYEGQKPGVAMEFMHVKQGSDFIKKEPKTVDEESHDPYQDGVLKHQVPEETTQNKDFSKQVYLIDHSEIAQISSSRGKIKSCNFQKGQRTEPLSFNEKEKFLPQGKQIGNGKGDIEMNVKQCNIPSSGSPKSGKVPGCAQNSGFILLEQVKKEGESPNPFLQVFEEISKRQRAEDSLENNSLPLNKYEQKQQGRSIDSGSQRYFNSAQSKEIVETNKGSAKLGNKNENLIKLVTNQVGQNRKHKGEKLEPKPGGKKIKHDVKQCLGTPEVEEIPLFSIDSRLEFEEQVTSLIRQVEQTEEERLKCMKVLTDVVKTYRERVPGIQAAIFGSTLTNLALKTSDVDIFLMCPQGQPTNFVKEFGRQIFRSDRFRNIIPVHRAKVPVMKATHIETGLNVDITASHRISVCNSKMISKLLEEADPRVRELAMLICLLGKYAKLTGPNRLKTYCWTLLVIFYLQQVDPPILPPLYKIISDKPSSPWPVRCEAPEGVFHTSNESSISTLLLGFFKFYSAFDYGENIISPFSGSIVSIHSLNDHRNIPFCYSQYEPVIGSLVEFPVNELFNVQDPLIASTNLTVGPKVFSFFFRFVQVVPEILENIPVELWLSKLFTIFNFNVSDRIEMNVELSGSYPCEKILLDFSAVLEDIFLFRVEKICSNQTTGSFWLRCTTNTNAFLKSRTKPIKHIKQIPNLSAHVSEALLSRFLTQDSKSVIKTTEYLIGGRFSDQSSQQLILSLLPLCSEKSKHHQGNLIVEAIKQNLNSILSSSLPISDITDSKRMIQELSSNMKNDIISFSEAVKNAMLRRSKQKTEVMAF